MIGRFQVFINCSSFMVEIELLELLFSLSLNGLSTWCSHAKNQVQEISYLKEGSTES